MVKGVFVGLSTIDVIYRIDAFLGPNSKVEADSQDIFAGGPATNAAITFSFLGGTPTLVAAVGRHPITRLMLEEFEQYSIRLFDLNPEFEQSPAISAVSVNQKGERSVVSANASRIGAVVTAVDEDVLKDASIVLVDGHQMEVCEKWAQAARERGVPVVLDGGSWKEGTRELIKNIDVAICSADFIPPGCSTQEDVLRYLRDSGVQTAAISNGPAPLRFASRTGFGTVRVPKVQVVDTLGAGDILHGAYCYYASTGYPFTDALGEAVRVASESCRYWGTREWVRRFQIHKRDQSPRK